MGFSLKKAAKAATNVISPVTIGFSSLPKNLQSNIKGLGQANVDFYKGLFTGNFGKAKDAFKSAGVNAGEATGLIKRPTSSDPAAAPVGPSESAIRNQGLAEQNDMLRRRRASGQGAFGTLFGTGGTYGSASTSLLGS